MWTRVTTRQQRRQFNDILLESPEYAGATVAGLRKIEARNQAELWLFVRPKFKLALSLFVDDSGVGRVVNCVPSGDFDGEQACKIFIRKIRSVLDRLGVEDFRIPALDTYTNPKFQALRDAVEEVIWEVDETQPLVRRVFQLRRVAARKSEDETFEGPKRKRRRLDEERRRQP